MSEVVLWHFPISHFNEKARWALDWKRIAHRRRVLGIDYLPRALWKTGRPTLPILFVDGTAIGDSTHIIAALERLCPEPALYPTDDVQRRRALELEDFFDEELGHHVRTLLLGPSFATDPDVAVGAIATGMSPRVRGMMRFAYGAFRPYYKLRHKIDATTIAAAPLKVRAAMDRIAAEIRPSGYLVGDSFSVADLTGASLLGPIIVPPQLQYPPPKNVQDAIGEVRASLGAHPALDWAAEMFRRHRGTSAELAASA